MNKLDRKRADVWHDLVLKKLPQRVAIPKDQHPQHQMLGQSAHGSHLRPKQTYFFGGVQLKIRKLGPSVRVLVQFHVVFEPKALNRPLNDVFLRKHLDRLMKQACAFLRESRRLKKRNVSHSYLGAVAFHRLEMRRLTRRHTNHE